MPCFTERTVGVDLKNVADPQILLRALEAAGYSGVRVEGARIVGVTPARERFEISEGQVKVTGSLDRDLRNKAAEISGDISRVYAKEVMRTVGKQYGFQITQDAKNPLHMTLNRRTF